GRNCQLISAVTIGSEHTLACPEIGDDVIIEAGVRVLGDVYIGDKAHLKANVVITSDVPGGATAACTPPRITTWESTWQTDVRGAAERLPAIAGVGSSDRGGDENG